MWEFDPDVRLREARARQAQAIKRVAPVVISMWLVSTLLCLCVVGGAIYVAQHFILKWW